MGALCRPTVHDVQLTERIAALHTITPGTIRRASKEVASQGLAGRPAGQAACAALAAERESVVVTNFQLLLRLVQQEERAGTAALPPEDEHPAGLERRAKHTIARIAPRLGQDAAEIGAGLEALAAFYDPIGLGQRPCPARLPHAIGLLKLLRQEAASLPTESDEHAPALLEMLVNTADVTLALAERALAEARAAAGHVTAMLVAWRANPMELSRALARTDWLMDGWDRIGQLWAADPRPASRREALEEIASLLPVIPREAGECSGFRVEVHNLAYIRRTIRGHHDWRTGLCVQDMIARNEMLLAA